MSRWWAAVRIFLGQRKLRVAVEVQANFNAVGMNTSHPIHRCGALEIVPLDAEAALAKFSPQRVPACAERAPDIRLAELICADSFGNT